MLYDFLYDCQNVIINEIDDYQEVLRKYVNRPTCIGFMPAITDDLYPVFALSCTTAKQIISPNVYIIPVGGHDYWAVPNFEKIFDNFYQNDEFREQFDIELEEVILLSNPRLRCSFSLSDGTKYNLVLCRITMPNREEKDLIIVPDTPDDCWNNIIEHYEIKCDIVIDSHKGMGGWFESIPLYKAMRETKVPRLLPHYYFRGLYISCDPPEGFNLLFTIPDIIHYQGHGLVIADCQKEIYEIDWDKNKSCP